MSGSALTGDLTMQESAQDVARRFLQSVVVVDDRAAYGGEGETLPRDAAAAGGVVAPPLVEVSGDSRSRGRRHLSLRSPPVAGKLATPEQSLDAKVLVDGFAGLGIVCAVIRPAADEA